METKIDVMQRRGNCSTSDFTFFVKIQDGGGGHFDFCFNGDM